MNAEEVKAKIQQELNDIDISNVNGFELVV
jgi:hypothetical protein